MPNEFRVKRGLIVETTGSISGSNVVTVDGVAGRLFTVVDTFSGSLFSVNTVAGLPVIEAFSDNTVRIGQYGQRALYVSQSRVGIGKETLLTANLDVSGTVNITGSLLVNGAAPGGAAFPFTGSALITGSLTIASSSFSGSTAIRLNVISGAIRMGPYTASGHILLPDINEWGAAAAYGYPQVRLQGSLTGITMGNVDEIYFICNTAGILGLKSESGNSRALLPSHGWLVWGSSEINGFGSKDIILKRKSAGVLDITGSVDVSGSLTHHVTYNRQTASYTLAATDDGRVVEMNVASANNLTIPLNSTVPFKIGTQITAIQYGAGQTTIVATGGVTIRSANNWLKFNAQYGAVTLLKVGTDEWYAFGNLSA